MPVLSETEAAAPRLRGVLTSPYLLVYVAAYGVLLAVLHRTQGLPLSEPLPLLLVVGIGFSALAWWLTRRLTPVSFAVHRPAREAALVMAYLAAMIIFLTWGLQAIRGAIETPPWQSAVIVAAKLIFFVLLPAALVGMSGRYRISELFPVSGNAAHLKAALWMSLALLAMQAVLGRGLGDLRKSGLGAGWLLAGAPLAFAWLTIEVGLVEEFFFRTLLQSRLAALLRSEIGGIVLMSVLFGLAHAPGFYLRPAATMEALGPHPSLLMAMGYSIVVTSVAGFFLGVLWSRTRNLAVVMLVHAAGDLLPSLTPALTMWRGLLSNF
ncbi:MAG: CPBP family intramembrane glutamic endopeptidase [Terriglobales bacterium]